ncbi:MAG: DUF917 domain-containing protein [Firmicutes bacterium]|jgi:DUF917 family protein|nr:DUF917 domain-containing protein [Bacillota bacterium]
MSSILNKEDIRNVLYGATFLGSGGGGSLKDGLRLLDVFANEEVNLELLNPSDMEKETYAASVGGIGAPSAIAEGRFGPEAIYAFEAMQKIGFFSGKDIRYVMGGELGGFNTMVPMYVAIKKGIPFIDGDGNGRAVPELSTGLQPIHDVLPFPLVVAGGNGDVVGIFLKDHRDHASAENLARHVSMAKGMAAAFCTWLATGEDIINKLAPNTITESRRIGEAFVNAKAKNLDLEKEISKVKTCKKLCQGEITDIRTKTEGGFDFGTTLLRGSGNYAGQKFSVDFKNENVIIRDGSGDVLLTVPDMICMVNTETLEPLTNADIHKGMTISLYGTSATENWWKNDEGFNNWRHILTRIGYKGGVVKFKG